MEKLDYLLDCSNLQNKPTICGSDELAGNCVDGRWQQSESVFPTTFGSTPEKVSTCNPQFIPSERTASRPANCGLRVLSSLVSHTSLKNAEVDGFNLGLPSVVPNYMVSPKQTVLLKSGIPANACIGDKPSSRMQFESSQTHLKRFIMFDHSAGKGRIFLHPSLLQELSGHTPNASTYLESAVQGDFSGMDKPIDNVLKASVPYFGSNLDARLVTYRETVASAFATLQCMRSTRICNLAGTDGEHESPITASAAEAESSSRISCAGGNEPRCGTNSSYWHENTEEIDALLYSDDEVTSTGHFPEDVLIDEASVCDSHLKRRRTALNCEDEQVGATSSEGDSSGVSVVAASSPELTRVSNPQNGLAGFEKKDCHFFKATIVETCSKSVSDDKQNVLSFVSSYSTSATKARRRKIRRTVKTLRKIIPGGDCLDAAVVLDEAIQYLKSLQRKVQQLDASGHEKYTLDKQ